MRDLGSMPSPHDAFLLNVGLESLHLRVARDTVKMRKKLQIILNRTKKSLGLTAQCLKTISNTQKQQKYMPNGTCGVVSFGIKGGREAATKFMDSLKLAAIVTHVADKKLLPAPCFKPLTASLQMSSLKNAV